MLLAAWVSRRFEEHGVADHGRVEPLLLGRIQLGVADGPDHVGQGGGQGPERGQGALAGLGVAGEADQGQDDQPAVRLLGDERQGRGGHDVGDRRQLLGGGLGRGDEPGDRLGGGRQQQHPSDDAVQLVQLELQAGGDPEVAAAAADRPEQVGMGLGVGADRPAVGGDQLGGEQVVDGQAVLADQVADAAAQGDAADAHRGGVTEADGQPVPGRLGGHLPGGQAGLGPGGPLGGVDLQRLELRQVEHDPAVADAVAGAAVPATADGQLQPALGRERDHLGDLGGVGGPDDRLGSAAEPAVEQRSCLVVVGVVGGDHPTVDGGAQLPPDRQGLGAGT